MALSRLPRTSRFTHGVTSLKHEPSLFQSSSFLPFLFLLLSSLATPNTTSIRPFLSFDVSEATSVWQLHEIRGWNSLDAHCPVAAAFEAEPVTIDERRGLEVTSARLSFNLRELQLPPTIAHHRVALRTRPPPPPPVVHPRSNYRRKHSRASLLLLHCTTNPLFSLPPAWWGDRPLFTRQARWARERTPRA